MAKWKTSKGQEVKWNVRPFLIKWSGKSLSKFQFSVKQFLWEYWKDDLVGEEVVIPRTRLRVDFINFTKKVSVETSGGQHVSQMSHWQPELSDFHKQINRDVLKEDLLLRNGFQTIEIFEKNMPITEAWFVEKFGVDALF